MRFELTADFKKVKAIVKPEKNTQGTERGQCQCPGQDIVRNRKEASLLQWPTDEAREVGRFISHAPCRQVRNLVFNCNFDGNLLEGF